MDLFHAGYPERLHEIAAAIGGKYAFVREIASGQNGTTYELIEKVTGVPYCLKTVSEKVKGEKNLAHVRRTLEKEVSILRPLNHRCLPRIYESNTEAALPFYVSTFHPGMTWEKFRASGHNLRVDASSFVILSIIDALDYLHSRGRTHCDLHQENILISENTFAEGILIIDFGSGHRRSDPNPGTPDRGNLGLKNRRGQARFRQPVERYEAEDDFRAYDFAGLGRALTMMAEIFFCDASEEQREEYDQFCGALQDGTLTEIADIRERFEQVVDPRRIISQNSFLYRSTRGSRDEVVLPTGPVPIGDAVQAVVDCEAFQRLRGVKQLSFCEWLYPGGVHSRFEHSLGVFAATKLAVEHLSRQAHFRNRFTTENVRGALLAGLLHDIGHYPYAHVIEHYAAGRFADDAITRSQIHHATATRKILENDKELRTQVAEFWGPNCIEHALQVMSGEMGVLSEILDGPIDCDKIDYLKRDSYHCGVPYGIGFSPTEVIESFRCSQNGENLLFSSSAVHAIEGFMVLQDQMLSAVYWDPGVRGIFAMFHRFLDGTVSREPAKLVDIVERLKTCANEFECIHKVFMPLMQKGGRGRGTREELEPLVRMHYEFGARDIYKPIVRYSALEPVNRGQPGRIYSLIVNNPQVSEMTGFPIAWDAVRRLRECYKLAFEEKGSEPGRFDILVDVPWGKESNRVVSVFDDHSSEIFDITKITHLSASIFRNITAYSAPVRVYVSPKLMHERKSQLGSIRRAAEERFFDKDIAFESELS